MTQQVHAWLTLMRHHLAQYHAGDEHVSLYHGCELSADGFDDLLAANLVECTYNDGRFLTFRLSPEGRRVTAPIC